MGHFNDQRGGGFRGGKGGGFKKRWDNSERRAPGMLHKATCSECGKECEVPFRPTGDRPIFCSDCFAKKRADGDLPPKREFHDRPSFKGGPGHHPAPHDDLKKQIGELTVKIDRLVNSVERLARGMEEKASNAKSAPLVAKEKDADEKPASSKAVEKKAAKTKAPAAKKVAAKKKK